MKLTDFDPPADLKDFNGMPEQGEAWSEATATGSPGLGSWLSGEKRQREAAQ